jgi:hypothetical protein
MSNEVHLEGAGHETIRKDGVYKQLRANPYLLGLSTVKTHHPAPRMPIVNLVCSSRLWEDSSSVTTKVSCAFNQLGYIR